MSGNFMTINELQNEEPSCKPLDSYEEILAFLEDPPSWRSLCKEMTPHSKDKIRNMSMNTMEGAIAPDRPPTFCHFSPDQEDVEREPATSLPKTLVCHDMANGYHDDSMIDGTSNNTAYTFYHWGGIDIFCYFSHHLITIPPVGWINTGHAHGVKVIGTVITEWTEGIDFWDYVLEEEVRYQELASALVTIAKTLKFDGWLLNIENKVSKPLVLLEFVQYFHRKLHEEIEDSVLIWYDSVTIKGNLNWQNGLNDSNKDFFDACDGFFTNYSWKEEDVASSMEAAGARVTDLYIGIDVWGRNFYGGGQFNTAAAVELAGNYGCSLAIFAPAWTHEAAERRDADIALAEELDLLQHLLLRERALWGSLWPFLNTSLPCQLPFQTSFCRGQGSKRRLYGEVMSPGPWYNLRHMQYQPNSAYGPHGYLLSTPELIEQVSHHGIIRDKTKGIIKYNSAFEASRHELHRVRSTRELHELQELREREHHDSLTVVQDTPPPADTADMPADTADMPADTADMPADTVDTAETPDTPAPRADSRADDSDDDRNKHSMKNTFKHMFRLKSRRRSQDAASEHSHAAHSHHDLKTGWSMRQLSLSLHLGQHAGKPHLALACVLGENMCLEPYFDDSYTGGSCLRVHPSDPVSPEHRWTRLFHCDFPCENELIVCVVTKTLPGHVNQCIDLKLFARNALGQELRVTCVGRVVPGGAGGGAGAGLALTLYPLAPGPAFSDLQKYLLLNQPGFYQSPENSFGWKVRYYVVPLGAVRVTSINVHCGLNHGPILLGHIGLCHRYEEEKELYSFVEDKKLRVERDTQQPGQCRVCADKAPSAGRAPGADPPARAPGADPPARDAAGRSGTSAAPHDSARTVETDLPRISRVPKKVEYEKLPTDSTLDQDEPSFHGAFELNFVENDVGLSPLGSIDSEGTLTAFAESKVSLSRPTATVSSIASEISDRPKSPIDSRTFKVSESPENFRPESSNRSISPSNSKTLENSDISISPRHSRTLENSKKSKSPRGSKSFEDRSRSPRSSQSAEDRSRSPKGSKCSATSPARRVRIAFDD